jgi:hypothetical protein
MGWTIYSHKRQSVDKPSLPEYGILDVYKSRAGSHNIVFFFFEHAITDLDRIANILLFIFTKGCTH